MNPTNHEPLNLGNEELGILAELLEAERTRLLGWDPPYVPQEFPGRVAPKVGPRGVLD